MKCKQCIGRLGPKWATVQCDKTATVVFSDVRYYCSKHGLEYLKEYQRTLKQWPDWEFANAKN